MKQVFTNKFLIKRIEKIKETSGIYIGDYGDSVLDFGELVQDATYISNDVIGVKSILKAGTIIAYHKNKAISISDTEAVVDISQVVYYEERESQSNE